MSTGKTKCLYELDDHLVDLINATAISENRSKTSVVSEALSDYFRNKGASANNPILAIDRAKRDLAIIEKELKWQSAADASNGVDAPTGTVSSASAVTAGSQQDASANPAATAAPDHSSFSWV